MRGVFTLLGAHFAAFWLTVAAIGADPGGYRAPKCGCDRRMLRPGPSEPRVVRDCGAQEPPVWSPRYHPADRVMGVWINVPSHRRGGMRLRADRVLVLDAELRHAELRRRRKRRRIACGRIRS